VKVVKNKVAPPFKEAEFDIMYGEGISKEGCILDLGVAKEFIDKSGSWFSYNGTRIGQGKDGAKQYLKDNPDTRDEIEAKIRASLDVSHVALETVEEAPSIDSEILGIDL
jgi:recombination protein RecA